MSAVEVLKTREGAQFRVKAQPGAPRTAIKGEQAGALKVAVQAPPEKGKANEALVRFLAESLGLDRRALSVVSGESARHKSILVRGANRDSLAAALTRLLAPPPHGKNQEIRKSGNQEIRKSGNQEIRK